MGQNKAVLGKDKQPCVINLKISLLAPGVKESPGAKAPSPAATPPTSAGFPPGSDQICSLEKSPERAANALRWRGVLFIFA